MSQQNEIANRIQIRLRTDEDFSDIEHIKPWINKTTSGFAFLHDLSGNHHYHIYLFGVVLTTDNIRKVLGKYYPKTCYMASHRAQMGKKEITPIMAYQYATKPASNSKLVWYKGFTDEQLECFKQNSDEFYKYQGSPLTAVQIERVEVHSEKTDKTWEHKLRPFYDDYKGLSVKQIQSKLAAKWLNQGKAIPRPSDSFRYAMSLYLMNEHKGDIPDDAYQKALQNNN